MNLNNFSIFDYVVSFKLVNRLARVQKKYSAGCKVTYFHTLDICDPLSKDLPFLQKNLYISYKSALK